MKRTIEAISIPYTSAITDEQYTLEGELRSVVNANATVILCHPHPLYGGDMHNNVIDVLFHGFGSQSTVRFNFSGIGRSQGQFEDGFGEVGQVAAVIDLARARFPDDVVHVVGYSFGAIVAAVAALGRDDVTSFTGIALPFSLFPALTNRMVDLQATSQKPLLLIMGTRDDFTRVNTFESWLAKLQGPVETAIVDGATHFFNGYEHRLLDIIEHSLAP